MERLLSAIFIIFSIILNYKHEFMPTFEYVHMDQMYFYSTKYMGDWIVFPNIFGWW